jgi:hypothetical protein
MSPFITPPLHHSSRLPQRGKRILAPSGGSPKPGPLRPDFLFSCLFSIYIPFHPEKHPGVILSEAEDLEIFRPPPLAELLRMTL